MSATLVVREMLKVASRSLTAIVGQPAQDIVILMYHRVSGDVPVEIDLRYEAFQRQMNWLAEQGRVFSLDEALAMLEGRLNLPNERPGFVITFDDAYHDFYTHAFPLLRDLNLPATLYVPSGFIDQPDQPPVSVRIEEIARLQPLTWDMLAELMASPLITLGAHTHRHLELPGFSDVVVVDECERCDDLLLRRLGIRVSHFAYPRGVWDQRVERLIKRRYRSIALVGGGAVRKNNFDPHRLSRVPVLRSDDMRWFHARIKGQLIYEEMAIRGLKKLMGQRVAGYG